MCTGILACSLPPSLSLFLSLSLSLSSRARIKAPLRRNMWNADRKMQPRASLPIGAEPPLRRHGDSCRCAIKTDKLSGGGRWLNIPIATGTWHRTHAHARSVCRGPPRTYLTKPFKAARVPTPLVPVRFSFAILPRAKASRSQYGRNERLLDCFRTFRSSARSETSPVAANLSANSIPDTQLFRSEIFLAGIAVFRKNSARDMRPVNK